MILFANKLRLTCLGPCGTPPEEAQTLEISSPPSCPRKSGQRDKQDIPGLAEVGSQGTKLNVLVVKAVDSVVPSHLETLSF